MKIWHFIGKKCQKYRAKTDGRRPTDTTMKSTPGGVGGRAHHKKNPAGQQGRPGMVNWVPLYPFETKCSSHEHEPSI